MQMIKKALVAATFLTSISVAVPAQALCIQDQSGGQWNVTLDPSRLYIYGLMVLPPGTCDAAFWYVLGSWVQSASGLMAEFTAVNELGDNDSVCVEAVKLKGLFPNYAFHYSDGTRIGSPGTWSACVTPAAPLTPSENRVNPFRK